MKSNNTDFDVVVVGAGAGGIGAAREFRMRPEMKTVVLEARTRVGGRVFTNPHLPRPFDYGAQYFDTVVRKKDGTTENPLYDLAIAQKVRVVPESGATKLMSDGKAAPEEDALAVLANLLLMDQLIKAAGQPDTVAELGDVSCADAVASLKGTPLLKEATSILVNQRGMMERMSAADYYNQTSLMKAPIGVKSDDTFLIPDGYGTFLTTLAEGLDIRLGTPVTAIDATDAGVVKITTPDGTMTAKDVVLAVPLGVLTAGRIAFTPGLPNRVLSGLDDLPMAVVDKVGIEFSERVFADLEDNTMVGQFLDSEMAPSFITKFMGANMASMLVGGQLALDLEAGGKQVIDAFAREAVRLTFGWRTAKAITQTVCNPWGTDQWAMGSWTMARPGGAAARETLTEEPIHGRIYLAGEPFDRQKYATAHGAFSSGIAAAKLIVKKQMPKSAHSG